MNVQPGAMLQPMRPENFFHNSAVPRAGDAGPAQSPSAQDAVYGPSGSMVYGSVSLDLHFSRSETLTQEYTRQGQDGYQSVRRQLSRQFDAGLSLDFSFLSSFDGAAEKMSKLDPAVFQKWAATAGSLMDMRKEDFQQFVKATDELFNEIEKVLGMGPTGLDQVAQFFSSQVDSFLNDVRNQMSYYDNHPLGQGKDQGLGIPAMLESARQAIPDNLQKFIDAMAPGAAQDTTATNQKSDMIKLLQSILDAMNNEPKKTDISPPKPGPDTNKPSNEAPPKPDAGLQYALKSSYSMEQVTSISATMAYARQTEPVSAPVAISA